MSEITQIYNEADKLKDAGQLDEAVAKFKEALAIDENNVLTHLALSVCYGKLAQHALSVEHAEKACELEPTDPFNFTALSVTYQRAFEGTRDEIYIQKAEEAKYRGEVARGGAQ
ncbi:MAG: scaffolding protein [Blastopirellula sp.]|nr:MAG: scaffolding protein [Blastopirellula sp.]